MEEIEDPQKRRVMKKRLKDQRRKLEYEERIDLVRSKILKTKDFLKRVSMISVFVTLATMLIHFYFSNN